MKNINIQHQPPMRNGSPDDFQTPPEALEPLIPYLNKDWTIWECAVGKGNLFKALKDKGFEVLGSDINSEEPYSIDFLKEKNLVWEMDCIVTNPPFSLKQEFLERCYELQKPFALLLPLTTFETAKRQNLFKKYGLQIIFFDKRINFETPSGKGSGSWFATAWFCWGLNLPKDMMFVKLKRESQTFTKPKEELNRGGIE